MNVRKRSAFREHFLDKYFAYRRRYVDYILAEAPNRAKLAVLSELARLTFSALGSALCALLLWFLAAGALARGGGGAAWGVLFGACALAATWFVCLALGGIVAAARDRRRVEERTGG